jgi:hypothetical protein
MMTIEVCDEQIESIIVKELSMQLGFIRDDLENGKLGMFSYDPEENTKQMNKLAKALERVLEYYGGSND